MGMYFSVVYSFKAANQSVVAMAMQKMEKKLLLYKCIYLLLLMH